MVYRYLLAKDVSALAHPLLEVGKILLRPLFLIDRISSDVVPGSLLCISHIEVGLCGLCNPFPDKEIAS